MQYLAIFSWRIVGVVLLFYLAAHPAYAIDAKRLFKRSHQSVVVVLRLDEANQQLSAGTGFFVGDGKTVVTSYHVIAGASALRLKLYSGKTVTVNNVLGVDPEHELALLAVEVPGKPLKLNTNKPEIGEKIIAIGNPRGLEATLSTGIVSGIRRQHGATYYQVTTRSRRETAAGPS